MPTHYIDKEVNMVEKIVVMLVVGLMTFIGVMATIMNLGRKK
jgi:hypothetical protein